MSGQENTVGMPVYIPTLNYEGGKIAGGDQQVIIPMKGVAGAEVIIAPNSVTLPDGRTEGHIMFSQVQTDKVPMLPPNGATFDMAWTLQPAGTDFNPPARISLPNSFGASPGEEREMFSFDHDLMEWVSIGPGVVTEDGSRIISREGHGVRHAGWGGAPPPPEDSCQNPCKGQEPGECFTLSAGYCFCEKNPLGTETVTKAQAEGDCATNTCGGVIPGGDAPEDQSGDCAKPACDTTISTTSQRVIPIVKMVPDNDPPTDDVVGDCKKPACETGTTTVTDVLDDESQYIVDNVSYCKKCGLNDEGDPDIIPDSDKNEDVVPNEECKICEDGDEADIELTIDDFPESMCEGETKEVRLSSNSEDVLSGVTFDVPDVDDLVNFNYLGQGVYSVTGQHRERYSVTFSPGTKVAYENQGNECASDYIKIRVFPENVEDLNALDDAEKVASSKSCPNLGGNGKDHEIDGCSTPVDKAEILVSIINYLIDNDIPINGPVNAQDPVNNLGLPPNAPNKTAFGAFQGTLSSASQALYLPCNQHDICYQTCKKDQLECDSRMYSHMKDVCRQAYGTVCPYPANEPNREEKCHIHQEGRKACFFSAQAFYRGLRLPAIGGVIAHRQRQIQYCKCCGN